MLAYGKIFFLTLYIDDTCEQHGTAGGTEKKLSKDYFEIKDLGEESQYPGMTMTRKDGIIKVDQKQYMKDMLRDLNF